MYFTYEIHAMFSFCLCVWCMHVCTCGGQKRMPSVVLQCSTSHSLENGPLTDPGAHTNCCCCFNVYWCFAYMYTCDTTYIYAQWEQIFSLELELWTAMGSGSSGRAANTLHHWAISPDSTHQFFIKLANAFTHWAVSLAFVLSFNPPGAVLQKRNTG